MEKSKAEVPETVGHKASVFDQESMKVEPTKGSTLRIENGNLVSLLLV
jgi:hypothetical protein